MDTNLYEQRTRVQNQLTNTFLKGMDTDTSDMLLGSDQYRYAENIRLITNTDNNTGEARLIEGTTKLETVDKLNELGETIIASNSIRDIAVFITINHDNKWSVYRLINTTLKRVFGPCEELIWNNDNKSISTVLRWESDKNIKLYIADSTGKHSIMTLNIAPGKELKEEESLFNDVFGYLRSLLPPLVVDIAEGSGNIISGQVLYAYRLYSKNKPATQISVLSKPLKLYRNLESGYESEKPSGRAVNILIDPSVKSNTSTYILIYRISYQISGQLPKISLIKDQKCNFLNTIDSGIDIEEISVSDFLSMIAYEIYPSLIETKGDYLFAANIKYPQDDADKKFVNFDSRSYSFGNKYNHNRILDYTIIDDDKYVLNTNPILYDIPIGEIPEHDAFNDNGITPEYNEDHWKDLIINSNNPDLICNGYGKCVCWKYDYDNISVDTYNRHPLPNNQTGTEKDSNSTFRCGETYRFGIKLFDKFGKSSSVKWIADIMIPSGANMFKDLEQGSEVMFRNVGIKFFKTPGSDLYWQDVGGWEIVRCERKLKDRKSITQGLIGFPVREGIIDGETNPDIYKSNIQDTNLICTPGVFSTDYFFIDSNYSTTSGCKVARTYEDIIMFSSPEYCYLEDDIKDILTAYKTKLQLTPVYTVKPNTIRSNTLSNVYTEQENNEQYSFPFRVGKVVNDNNNVVKHGYFLSANANANDHSNLDRGVTITDGTAHTVNYFNYFTPDYDTLSIKYTNDKTKINDILFVDSPKSSDFAKSELLLYKNSVKTINNLQFINWSAPLMLDLKGTAESTIKLYLDNYTDKYGEDTSFSFSDLEILSRSFYPIGSGGKTILLKQDQKNIKFSAINPNEPYTPSITVMNLCKNCIPYDGYNKTSIDNSEYISFGNYSNNIENPISVFSGDTKISVFTYNAVHYWYDSTFKNCFKIATVYAIPVETDIDIQALYGLLYGVEGFTDYRIQDIADAFDDYTLQKSAYLYNPAYNATPDIVSWTTPEQLESKIDQFDTRIHYSNVKTNNEDIDSWLQFQAANYIDVDTRYGEITDLKLFKDKLIFWQENATGILAVNERIVLNDQNDTQVVLGTGGVLERYDYFSTTYGQKKNLHVRTMSNNSLYWWDGNNKEILLYQQKYDVTPLSTVKHIKNYINTNNESITPFMAYDPKYKEVLMNVVNNECVVYNEYIEAFTSIYKFNPLYEVLVNGTLYLTDTEAVYKYNSSDEEKSKLFSNEAVPYIKYVVNHQPTYNKVFDIQTFGGRFYDGSGYIKQNNEIKGLSFDYKTPLKQHSYTDYKDVVTDREYDFRLTIPRNMPRDVKKDWGDRMRGKTMQCEIKSNSNNLDFALQYVTTKFRMSWT